MTFRSALSLDGTHRAVTLVLFGVIVVSVVGAIMGDTRLGIGVAGVVGCIFALAWAIGPREIVVDSGELRIERRAWRPRRIPLSEVESAGRLSSIGKTLRLLGVGGVFGSYGLFSSTAIGQFWLYATRKGQAVIVRRKNGDLPIVLTPDDVQGTIEAITTGAAGPGGRT